MGGEKKKIEEEEEKELLLLTLQSWLMSLSEVDLRRLLMVMPTLVFSRTANRIEMHFNCSNSSLVLPLLPCTGLLLFINNKPRTSNSALYLRLKKRKRLFLKKKLEFFSFRKCRIIPKNVKGGTLWALLTYILLQNIKKKSKGGTL